MEDELTFLYGLMREGIKLDLDIMRSFSDTMGNPESRFRSIHVAGTNGKGSTSSFIFNILRQKYRTGLYTSPHLVRFNERIFFDRDQIDDEYIAKFVRDQRKTISDLAELNRNPTFFETTTMLAFKYFAEKQADYSVIEVGLGGRLDSTNIITPEVSVITQIGYEHADRLGCSLTSIATEKGGIIKRGVPVILADEKPEVSRTIQSISSVRESELHCVGKETRIRNLKMSQKGTEFTLITEKGRYELKTHVLGEFQVRNIRTAILALENSKADALSENNVETGILETRWPGRMEVIRNRPKVVIDSSHNPPAASSLVWNFKKIFRKKPLLVLGMLSDKDAYSYLSVMKNLSDEVIFTAPREEKRAMDPADLARKFGHMFKKFTVIRDPIEAYEKSLGESGLILVSGSIYLVGLIKEYEDGKVIPFHLN